MFFDEGHCVTVAVYYAVHSVWSVRSLAGTLPRRGRKPRV
jgi:hypothetical protein